PRLGFGRLPVAALAEGLVQLLEQLALVLGELDRRLDLHVAVQIAGVARAHAFDALAAQPERLAVLRPLGQFDLSLAAQRRHLDATAQCRRRERHGYRAVEVVAIALEDLVLLHADLDVEIPRRPAVGAGLAIAG